MLADCDDPDCAGRDACPACAPRGMTESACSDLADDDCDPLELEVDSDLGVAGFTPEDLFGGIDFGDLFGAGPLTGGGSHA